jgi:phosphoserine phosphatase RsbU/P
VGCASGDGRHDHGVSGPLFAGRFHSSQWHPPAAEIAVEHLQAGDRVLFHTDGVTETRSTAGEQFGLPPLIDFLVRAGNERTAPVETLRSMSAAILDHNDAGLSDDATLVIVEYHGNG